MDLKSEKGYTGIDIAISVVILFIFVSMIAILSYRINSIAKETDLKAEATAIAVEEIEKLKNKSFEEISIEPEITLQEIVGKEGFYKSIKIEDYSQIAEGKISGLVKQATVTISYKFKTEEQKVELATIFSKEN